MATLSIEFAFEGFRIIRKRPWAVLAWGVVLLIVNAVGFGSFIPLLIPAVEQLSGLAAAPDPATMAGLMARMILPYLILLIAMAVGGAIVSCAIFRTALHDHQGGFGNLRFGGDELRLILVHILFALVFLGIYLVCFLAGALLVAAISVLDQDLAPLGMIPAIIGIGGLMVWLLLRLSLFPVQSFDEKKINLFGSWKLTKGNSWTLLGGYLLALVLAVVVETVVMTVVWIIAAIVMAANLGAFQELSQSPAPPQFSTILSLIAPAMITYIGLFSLLVQPLMMAILIAPAAAAYRSLSGRHPAAVEKIF